jgi:hypothetical protein
MSSVLSKLTLLQSFTSMVQGSDESSVMGFYLESFFSSLIKGGSRGGSNLDLVDVYQLPDDGGKKFFYSLKFYEGNPNQFRTNSYLFTSSAALRIKQKIQPKLPLDIKSLIVLLTMANWTKDSFNQSHQILLIAHLTSLILKWRKEQHTQLCKA